MQTFLSNVIDDILSKEYNISDYTFILPSKRAGVFLKDEIKRKSKEAIIFPKIISIEDFIGELSLLNIIDNTTLLFEFYSVYKNLTQSDYLEDFDTFSKWATIALQDFNEIDRHLVDTKYIFNYLKDINQLEKWSLEKGSETTIIKNYFSFFERLEKYYFDLNNKLLSRQQGYQGLQYRESVENLQNYIENNKDSKLIFIGFNALNKAEEIIIQELLENEIATIYWDADQFYFNNNQASIFLKKYKTSWKYYQNNSFNWIQENFEEKKNIRIIGTPKNNTQLKYVGELLTQKGVDNFQNTALVLADESLLPLALNSLPNEVADINITMGYELKNMPVSQLFSSLLKLHVNSKKGELTNLFYYKDVLKVLNQPSIKSIVTVDNIITEILKNNYIFIDDTILSKLSSEKDNLLSILFLFTNWEDNANKAIGHCLDLIELLKNRTNTTLEKEFLFKLKSVFQQIETLNSEFGYIKNIKTLQVFYNQLLSYEKLSFKGEPLSGLQVMGMLETRVLDFETVILTSVNEGILPAGKSENSFIPFDVKKEVGLPTYQEKDAIFSYHFYRLLQRAKNVYLLYNTESDQYGSGEQSRFITQLEINKPEYIHKSIVSPKIINSKSEQKIVHKNRAILEELEKLAKKGFSPTALTTYVYNPIDFYHQKILGIKESEDVEETVAANTLGTIIHKVLEAFYLPLKGEFLKKEDVIAMQKETAAEVKKYFKNEYKNGDITSGKNLLIYNVAQQFIKNFLKQELHLLEQGKQLKIRELEHKLNATIHVEGIDFPIHLRGEADRIDELDGVIRIVDYKTGKVSQTDLNIKDWQLISSDYKKGSKPFQVLLYAFMYADMHRLNYENEQIESGIISFKNLKAGFMKVNKKAVNNEEMANFMTELKTVLLEIFNPEIPFMEKENLPF
jgi:hypothetical protein